MADRAFSVPDLSSDEMRETGATQSRLPIIDTAARLTRVSGITAGGPMSERPHFVGRGAPRFNGKGQNSRPAKTDGVDRQKAQTFRGRWRDQTFNDPELTPAAFKVAYYMADFATMWNSAQQYSETGSMVIFPSQIQLAEGCNLSRDTISNSVAQLAERGHLRKLTTGNQRIGSSRYELLLKVKYYRRRAADS